MKRDFQQALIVIRCVELTTPGPGSIRSRCRDCGQQVWMYPTTVRLRELDPHLPAICSHCLMEYDIPEKTGGGNGNGN